MPTNTAVNNVKTYAWTSITIISRPYIAAAIGTAIKPTPIPTDALANFLTTSEKRDGHGLFGKNLIESYLCGKDKYYSIFIRLSKEDFINLKKRNQKEFSFLSKSRYINLKCFDDLIFSDDELKKKIINIRNINLFKNRQNELMKRIKNDFYNGKIRIKDWRFLLYLSCIYLKNNW